MVVALPSQPSSRLAKTLAANSAQLEADRTAAPALAFIYLTGEDRGGGGARMRFVRSRDGEALELRSDLRVGRFVKGVSSRDTTGFLLLVIEHVFG